ncbi:MAG: DNA helicase RecQ [Eubacteriales bacterium]
MTANEMLKQIFGYDTFRSGQQEMIDEILVNRDVLGIMPTGAGKSICYQVPALMMSGITIVISPLISLMQDQVKALNQAGVSAAYINSSLSQTQINKALQYAVTGKYKIIYVAPERLLTENFLVFATSEKVKISMLTVDEAHCISQWGQDFRPSYAQIPQFLSMLAKSPTVSAFTATATEQVKEDIIQLLELRNPFTLVTGFDRENLYLEVVQSSNKMQDLLKFLEERKDQNGIIYCATRKNVESVCQELRDLGYWAASYHAGLSQNERQENQNDFQYDQVKIMVATNAFGMGIDKSNVNYVVHYNMPKDLESYYQEAGRAGRDGSPAHCLLLYSAQDVVTQQWMIEHGDGRNYENDEMEQVLKERDYQRLKEMTFYSTGNQCLRQYILRYFGEEIEAFCGHCSNCDTKFETIDITNEVQEMLRCVEQMKGRYGKVLIVDVLRGSKTARVSQLGLEKLSSYGKCEGSVSRLRAILDYLIWLGYLIQTDEQYSVVKLTEKSSEILGQNISLEMKVAQEKEKAPSKSKSKSRSGKSMEVPEGRVELYDKLRALRGEIASKEYVPAFMVFADASLIDMCVKLPMSLSRFGDVSGVGAKKLEKYGKEFVEVVVEYCEEKNILVEQNVEETSSEEIKQSEKNTKKSRVGKRPADKELVLPTMEILSHVEITSEAVSISKINERINKVLVENKCTKTSAVKLGDWLVEQGYLKIEATKQGNLKGPTELGRQHGIAQEERTARGNTYQINLYSEEMQRYVVEEVVLEMQRC